MKHQADPLLATTTAGAVIGSWTGDAGGVRVWRGIPYAAAPVGPLRWRPPQAPASWRAPRPALRFSADAVQAPMADSLAPSMSEDCLYLNVWSPAASAPPPADGLPVMVWIHGGGFVSGSGADAHAEGTVLAREGVVVVSFNYRTGLFGFLAHPALSRESEAGVSGNYGLLDQLQALRWVRDNIAAFGGDPARVTVFGVSAGSASISLLLTSPMASGLFRQAILHSPGAGRPLASLADAERVGHGLDASIEALRRLSAEAVFALTSRCAPKVRGLTTPRVLRPIHDGWLIPTDERAAFAAGRLHAMPMIVGTNVDEGTSLTAAWPAGTVQDLHALVAANFPGVESEVLALYPADRDADARAVVAALFADTQFNDGARLLARAMSRLDARTWRYVFTRRRPGRHDGPHHGDEVAYVFGNLERGGAFDDTDLAVSRAMRAAWVAFARAGQPDGPGRDTWPAYTTRDDAHQVFGDVPRLGHGWRAPQLDFLDRYHDGH